jgi:hypothetical protein
MQPTQAKFPRASKGPDIPSHLTPVRESVLIKPFDAGGMAMARISGYHMVTGGGRTGFRFRPRWPFISACTTLQR